MAGALLISYVINAITLIACVGLFGLTSATASAAKKKQIKAARSRGSSGQYSPSAIGAGIRFSGLNPNEIELISEWELKRHIPIRGSVGLGESGSYIRVGGEIAGTLDLIQWVPLLLAGGDFIFSGPNMFIAGHLLLGTRYHLSPDWSVEGAAGIEQYWDSAPVSLLGNLRVAMLLRLWHPLW